MCTWPPKCAPRPRPGPVIRTPRQRAELIGGLKVLARQLEQLAAVEKVTLYEATVMAPPSGYVRQHKDQVRPARFDIVVLIAPPAGSVTCRGSGMREGASWPRSPDPGPPSTAAGSVIPSGGSGPLRLAAITVIAPARQEPTAALP
jgi:hypothetical protein